MLDKFEEDKKRATEKVERYSMYPYQLKHPPRIYICRIVKK